MLADGGARLISRISELIQNFLDAVAGGKSSEVTDVYIKEILALQERIDEWFARAAAVNELYKETQSLEAEAEKSEDMAKAVIRRLVDYEADVRERLFYARQRLKLVKAAHHSKCAAYFGPC